MPRKAAATTDSAGEPRRSARIKDLPKPDSVPKKAPAKPRAKKAPAAEGEEKPKSTKGKKRTASEKEAEDDAPEANGDEPPAKKVRPLVPSAPRVRYNDRLTIALGQACIQGCKQASEQGSRRKACVQGVSRRVGQACLTRREREASLQGVREAPIDCEEAGFACWL